MQPDSLVTQLPHAAMRNTFRNHFAHPPRGAVSSLPLMYIICSARLMSSLARSLTYRRPHADQLRSAAQVVVCGDSRCSRRALNRAY